MLNLFSGSRTVFQPWNTKITGRCLKFLPYLERKPNVY
jgi:hypothetical protein